MSRTNVNLYWCKLKLIRHGLLREAQGVEDAGEKRVRRRNLADSTNAESDGSETSGESSDDEDLNVIARRRAFVKRSIKEARRNEQDLHYVHQDEAIISARKAVIAEFKSELLQFKACKNCKA